MASAVAAGTSGGEDGGPMRKRSGAALWKLAAARSKDGRFLTLKDMEDGLPAHLTQQREYAEGDSAQGEENVGGAVGNDRMRRRPSIACAEIANLEATGAAPDDEQDLEGFNQTLSGMAKRLAGRW